MREQRRCAITGRHAVVSTERLGRPIRFRAATFAPLEPSECPFCPGNEATTLRTLDEVTGPDGWRCRAFPNRWPALALEEPARAWAEGPNDAWSGLGAHEVIVESRRHEREIWRTPGDLGASLALARRRCSDLERDRRLRHVHWFRNQGPLAGGSQPHPHGQIVAMTSVPTNVAGMIRRAEDHHLERGRELMGDVVGWERAGPRWLPTGAGACAWLAWAPQFGWETWIVPEAAGARFSQAPADVVAEVGRTLERTLAALDEVLPGFDANVVLVTGPADRALDGVFRWFLRVCPRRVAWGGFEVATDGSLLSVSPEHAAETMRAVWRV